MASTFSKARLEGRALEHVVAGDTAPGIRMREESTGKWAAVKTQDAKAALQYMKVRGKEVMEQLPARGLTSSGGDVPTTHQKDKVSSWQLVVQPSESCTCRNNMWEPKLPLALCSARGNFGSHMLG